MSLHCCDVIDLISPSVIHFILGGSTIEFVLDSLANRTRDSGDATRTRNALNMRLKDPVLAQYNWLEPEGNRLTVDTI